MAESTLIPTTQRPELDQWKLTTDMNVLHSPHGGGSSRCSKCVNMVLKLGQIIFAWHPPASDPASEYMGPARTKKIDQKPYQLETLCMICQHNLFLNEYHKLGNNLIEAHESTEKGMTMLRRGCCYMCLLLFQLKCRNGFFESWDTFQASPELEYNPNPFLWKWKPLFFGESIDEPVHTDLYLSIPSPSPSAKTFLYEQKEGQAIRIIPRQKIHWPSVKSWLKSCETGHAHYCGHRLLLNSKALKVVNRTFIDVNHQNLVIHPYECRYLALSYVWGGVSQLLLTKSNQELLFSDGALNAFEKDIPQVIKDAMQVVRSIGEELLWVDSLCIVQDDDLVKHDLISEMASIYNHALATIVAASGENAGCGLPGVRQNSRVLQNLATIPGANIHVMERKPLDSFMDNSTYNTRGWTFQERLLSRRCLYFTDTQVFFECQEHSFSEDRPGALAEASSRDIRDPSFHSLINSNLIDLGNPLASEEARQMLRYSKIVEEYCHKKFTFVDDILDAFSGIEAALEHLCGWTMVYGLPEQLLDHSLLWEPGEVTAPQKSFDYALFRRPKPATPLPMGANKLERRNSNLPSWSWSAWTGSVYYNEWIASELRAFHYPFKLVHRFSHSLLKYHLKPSVLSFSSEYLPGSTFSLKNTSFRNRQSCVILNSQGLDIGTIPGVDVTFAEDYERLDRSSVDMVLLSASKLAVHRFRSQEDMGYPGFFDARYSRDDWSVLTAMIIKWHEGCAERIALGYIHRDAWKEACPNVKAILLA